jgi:hypothetical protein
MNPKLTSILNRSSEKRFFINGSVIIFGFCIFVYTAYLLIPVSYDWHTFRAASLDLVSGRSPYGGEFYNPPWTLIPLIPLALLPLRIGSSVVSGLAIFSFGYLAYRLGAKPLAWAFILLSPPVLLETQSANVTWLAALGIIMPPQIGLFFVSMKPQVGVGIAVFWLFEAWQRGRWKEVIRIFGPITLVFALSLAIFGLWPLRITEPIALTWNSSLWPQSIPIGLVMLVTAIRREKPGLALASSPFLSPYLSMHTWVVAVLGLLPGNLEAISSVVGIWLWIFVTALGLG